MLLLKKIFSLSLAGCLCAFYLSGCAHGISSQEVHELHFSLDGISDVIISYDEEDITFFNADGSDLIIREYMTENKDTHHAKVDQHGNQLHISEGGKPMFAGNFNRYIEVYLPSNYSESLTVTTTDGNVYFSDMDVALSILRIDSTSGQVELPYVAVDQVHLSSTSGSLQIGRIEAAQIQLETTSGRVICDELNGYVTYSSTSGDLEVKSAIGAGTYTTNNSGILDVTYSAVTDNLYLFNKNDDIDLVLPEDLEFHFEAITKNGSVSTSFQEFLSIHENITSGTVGSSAAVNVKVETRTGDIEVRH